MEFDVTAEFIIGVFFILACLLLHEFGVFKQKPKVGEVWIRKNDNPFKDDDWTCEVLEIKEGWVKYKDHRLYKEDSVEIRVFINLFKF